ncbi:MAG: glycine--tRNA ligase [Candidatus Micrarchaeota archaeon]|nr:glycine--tRNA ligase [Candidatus Micrarchaeota archaeon]
MASKAESKAGDIAARRGIYFQAFGIYDGVAGFYDYGPIGVRIKRKFEEAWRSLFVNRTGALEIESTNIVPEPVLRASGHLSAFTDPMVACSICKTPYRADKLLEEYYEKRGMGAEAAKVKKMSMEQMEKKLEEHAIKCKRCGNKLGKVEKFNMTFRTQIGPTAGGNAAYLRPETAQSIFVDFIHLYKTYGFKLPVGIAQVGRAYRNEISPRQQLVRLRELTQMDLELFIDPEEDPSEILGFDTRSVLREKVNFVAKGSEDERSESIDELLKRGSLPNKYMAFLIYLQEKLMQELGIDKRLYRFRELEKEELPHYSKGNVDLEMKTSYGYIELSGCASRSDWDLAQHSKESGKELSITTESGKKVVPHVVELTVGGDRPVFAILDNSVVDDDGRGWKWLKLSERIAPYRYGVFPLQKDEKLIAKAREMFRLLQEKGTDCYYSETASIGKRYARADEIGVPYCITIDYTTLEDDTVTIRSRDTTKQTRKLIGEI